MDLWCAPTITGLYALLTHAQPFWGEVHTVLMQLLGGSVDSKQAEPLDPETARALCAMVLSVMFTSRTVNNSFGSYSKTLGQKKQGMHQHIIMHRSLIIFDRRAEGEDSVNKVREIDTRPFTTQCMNCMNNDSSAGWLLCTSQILQGNAVALDESRTDQRHPADPSLPQTLCVRSWFAQLLDTRR